MHVWTCVCVFNPSSNWCIWKDTMFQGYISDISTYIYNGLTGIYTNVMHVYATDKNMH